VTVIMRAKISLLGGQPDDGGRIADAR
jgi:hypothetical protein